ncbi:CoA transferase [Aquibacillus halophilus]|uniref:CoA transferase n=1 Tax=Aquibacillus halophilus TaxID=930132 RepID=A0A6A8D8E8_9BACI|nr:CoA transferase [Aquibacillus halophilus]MRH42033.1 CoA transferase [Aquibacillus halophilus]
MKKALAGMRVLDLTQVLAGPYCTMCLADMGADVIKIEKYPNGDDTRALGPFINEESYVYMMVNRNKRSIRLNLKEEEGKEILYNLVRHADVFIENFRPGVAAKLGIDYDTLAKLNKELIYCSISGYGQTGPYKDKGGYDIMAQGLSGIMSFTGDKGGRPVKTGIALHDIAAGNTAVQSILTAYIHRLTGGSGQYIDLSLVDSGLAWTVWEAASYFGKGEVPTPNGTAHRLATPYQGFKTKDGYILVGAANQKLWMKFCSEVVEKEEWITDSRFCTNDDRIANISILEEEIEKILVNQSSTYWLDLLEKANIPSGPIYSYDQTLNDPHINERDMIIEYDHPKAGKVKTLGFPAKYSKTPGEISRPAPTLGEHTEEVLKELGLNLDYSRLLTKGVI